MNRNLILRLCVIAAIVSAFVTTFGSTAIPTAAQSTNLLINPGLEKPYLGQGAPDQTAPTGWSLWFTGVPVTSFPHTDPTQIHGGQAAWNIRKGGAPFTAGGYQQVSGIALGSTIHATVWAQSYTCNDQVHSCIGGDGKHHSDTSSGAVVRVGIDPSGGTNPNSGQIVWSTNVSAYDNWTQLAVDAVNCNATVTIFLFTTQSVGMFINSVYFDDASLSVTTQGTGTTATCGPAPGAGTPGTAVPPTAAFAPFVQKQNGLQPDGSIIHVVVAGDTLAAIAYAYGVTLDQLRQLNNIQPGNGLLTIGQKIIVRGPTPITPTATFAVTIPAPVIPTAGAVIVVGPTPAPTPVIEVF
ncbi:MAG: LysM peptidoglycan-binding domain-containing protein [Aggregatilineales bacterium]